MFLILLDQHGTINILFQYFFLYFASIRVSLSHNKHVVQRTINKKFVCMANATRPWHKHQLKWSGKTHVVHVLAQQVLKGLSDCVALSHDALTAVITRAGRVGHERGATDDAFQTLLQRGSETSLAECQRVQDDLVLLGEIKKWEAEFADFTHTVWYLPSG